MSNSTRYFQLTPDILVEYNYCDPNSNSIIRLGNGQIIAKTLGWDLDNSFVFPVNKSESKFVQYKNGIYISGFKSEVINENGSCNVLYDTFNLQFTSRNYLGNNGYDGFIISINIYDKVKNKVCLFSHYVRKTDDISINENPILINQKLYTAHLSFKVPNVYELLNPNSDGEELLRSKLFPNYDIMDNTPIIMNIYGVKSTYVDNTTHEYYNVEKINSIYIPVKDKSIELSFDVEEADDGDYFRIHTSDNKSLSSFLEDISNNHPELYIVFHELTVTEHPVSSNNNLGGKITHHEQFIINGGKQTEDDIVVNKDDLDKPIYFRPIIQDPTTVSFDIDLKTYIINNLDNTTIVKTSKCTYPDPEKPEQDINKYGRKIKRIYFGDEENNHPPTQVKVYNKRPDIDIDGVRITNASSNVKIENHQHSVIGFIECANVGVSIEQVPKEWLE